MKSIIHVLVLRKKEEGKLESAHLLRLEADRLLTESQQSIASLIVQKEKLIVEKQDRWVQHCVVTKDLSDFKYHIFLITILSEYESASSIELLKN